MFGRGWQGGRGQSLSSCIPCCAGEWRPSSLLRDRALRLPTLIHSLIVKKLLSLSLPPPLPLAHPSLLEGGRVQFLLNWAVIVLCTVLWWRAATLKHNVVVDSGAFIKKFACQEIKKIKKTKNNFPAILNQSYFFVFLMYNFVHGK